METFGYRLSEVHLENARLTSVVSCCVVVVVHVMTAGNSVAGNSAVVGGHAPRRYSHQDSAVR